VLRFMAKDFLATPADERDPQRTGNLFIYVADRGSGPAIYSVEDGSERPEQLSQAGIRAASPQVSPDGQQVLFVAAESDDRGEGARDCRDTRRLRLASAPPPESVATRIWIVPATGGDPNPLTAEGEQAIDPMWLPGGDSFLYACRSSESEGFDIVRADLVAGRPVPLYGGPGDQLQPALRPGSDHLLFRSVVGGTGMLMLGDLKGGAPAPVAEDVNDPSHPAWSPGGRWVALDAASPRGRVVRILEARGARLRAMEGDPPLGRAPIWLNERALLVTQYRPAALEWIWLNQDDRPPHAVLADPVYDLGQPSISPQRTLVLYRCNGDLEVADIRPERPERRRVTDDLWEDSHPAWSPDGLSFVFESRREGNSDIFLRTFPALRERRLTSDPADDRTPRFTPDGRAVLFASNRDGTTALYRIDLEDHESRPVQLEAGRGGRPLHPDLSPVGEWIVYSVEWGEGRRVEVFNLETGEQRPLTEGSDPWVADIEPAFSPDGVYVSFHRNALAESDIYIVPSKRKGARLIESRVSKARRSPDWMIDGQSLIYSTGGSFDIALIELGGLW